MLVHGPDESYAVTCSWADTSAGREEVGTAQVGREEVGKAQGTLEVGRAQGT